MFSHRRRLLPLLIFLIAPITLCAQTAVRGGCGDQPVSMAFAAYGAGTSVYNNFLSRGKDVVFVKNTPLEIGLSEPHAKAATKP